MGGTAMTRTWMRTGTTCAAWVGLGALLVAGCVESEGPVGSDVGVDVGADVGADAVSDAWLDDVTDATPVADAEDDAARADTVDDGGTDAEPDVDVDVEGAGAEAWMDLSGEDLAPMPAAGEALAKRFGSVEET